MSAPPAHSHLPEVRPAWRKGHHRDPAHQPAGRRVYFRSAEVPAVLAGLGTSILTTSRGVMTGRAAMRAGVGGEVLCNIW